MKILIVSLLLLLNPFLAIAEDFSPPVQSAGQENRFASSYPASLQICYSYGAKDLTCASSSPLSGWDSVTGTTVASIAANLGCSNLGYSVFMCNSSSALGASYKANVVLVATYWAVPGSVVTNTATAFVSRIVLVVLG